MCRCVGFQGASASSRGKHGAGGDEDEERTTSSQRITGYPQGWLDRKQGMGKPPSESHLAHSFTPYAPLRPAPRLVHVFVLGASSYIFSPLPPSPRHAPWAMPFDVLPLVSAADGKGKRAGYQMKGGTGTGSEIPVPARRQVSARSYSRLLAPSRASAVVRGEGGRGCGMSLRARVRSARWTKGEWSRKGKSEGQEGEASHGGYISSRREVESRRWSPMSSLPCSPTRRFPPSRPCVLQLPLALLRVFRMRNARNCRSLPTTPLPSPPTHRNPFQQCTALFAQTVPPLRPPASAARAIAVLHRQRRLCRLFAHQARLQQAALDPSPRAFPLISNPTHTTPDVNPTCSVHGAAARSLSPP
ncbi:hypothetical protein K438DRAFT_1972852 [Mycena galopus ATCC 62051]|nr:hypothetical protein K438DRAFT_1972852 [Mycena galopus ATCC 62051]